MKLLTAALLIVALLSPPPLSAEDLIEQAGAGVGMTAGNLWVVPLKGIAVFWGLTAGALSFVLSGGDTEVTRQAWENATEGPYVVTPEVARTAIGQRPELESR